MMNEEKGFEELDARADHYRSINDICHEFTSAEPHRRTVQCWLPGGHVGSHESWVLKADDPKVPNEITKLGQLIPISWEDKTTEKER